MGIELDLPRELLLVLGDRIPMQQVLLNLFINGMDALAVAAVSKPIVSAVKHAGRTARYGPRIHDRKLNPKKTRITTLAQKASTSRNF